MCIQGIIESGISDEDANACTHLIINDVGGSFVGSMEDTILKKAR